MAFIVNDGTCQFEFSQNFTTQPQGEYSSSWRESISASRYSYAPDNITWQGHDSPPLGIHRDKGVAKSLHSCS